MQTPAAEPIPVSPSLAAIIRHTLKTAEDIQEKANADLRSAAELMDCCRSLLNEYAETKNLDISRHVYDPQQGVFTYSEAEETLE